MKVQELIKILEDAEPTAEVLVSIEDGKEISDVQEVGGDLESKKVWILLK